MELDLDFAIRIMEAIKQTDKTLVEPWNQILEDVEVEDERYSYHCLMMDQAGLIKIWRLSDEELMKMPEINIYYYIDTETAVVVDSRIKYEGHEGHRVMAFPMILTYEGHKFLDALQGEGAINKIRGFLAEKGLPLALTTAKEVAMKLVTG